MLHLFKLSITVLFISFCLFVGKEFIKHLTGSLSLSLLLLSILKGLSLLNFTLLFSLKIDSSILPSILLVLYNGIISFFTASSKFFNFSIKSVCFNFARS